MATVKGTGRNLVKRTWKLAFQGSDAIYRVGLGGGGGLGQPIGVLKWQLADFKTLPINLKSAIQQQNVLKRQYQLEVG